MKLILIIIAVVFSTACQSKNSKSCDFYLIALDNLNLLEGRPLKVNFDYKVSTSLMTSLLKSKFFKEDGKKIFDALEQESYSDLCNEVENKLVSINRINKPSESNDYISLNYASPVEIGNNKAYLFFEKLSVKTNKGVEGGAAMVHVFTRPEESAKWELSTTHVLEWF